MMHELKIAISVDPHDSRGRRDLPRSQLLSESLDSEPAPLREA
jgi:hypothetical protein